MAAEPKTKALPDACGCYVFGMRAAKGMRPWYVGKARRQPFKKECFTDHKLVHFNEVLAKYHRGTPVIFLIARTTSGGRFSKPTSGSGHPDVDLLETLLIGRALEQNSGLENAHATKMFREMVVPGIINSPPGQSAATGRLLKMLG